MKISHPSEKYPLGPMYDISYIRLIWSMLVNIPQMDPKGIGQFL